MTEFEDSFDRFYEREKKLEEANKASWKLTPDGELPTQDFKDAPATAKTVNQHPDPIPLKNEWDQLAWYEKLWNSAGGGYHNLQKGEAIDDITRQATELKEGIVGSLADDLEERFGDDEESKKKFEVLRGSNVDEDYKKGKEKELDKSISEFLRLSAYDDQYYTPDVVLRASQATEGKSFLDSIAPFVGEVAKNPMDYMLYLTGSSTGAIAPSLALSMVSGAGLSRLLKMRTTARAVQTALMGYGSYNAEFGNYLTNYFQEKGYDLQDANSIRKAIDTENLTELRGKALRRAAVVGMFDAFSAWIAPMRLNPSNALRFLRSNAAKATTGLVAPVSRTVRFGKGMENLALQTSLQGVLGGAGEAFGQVVNGEKINWGEVFAEAIGEFSSAPFEVLGLSWSVNKEFNTETQRYQDAKKVEDLGNQVCTAVRAINQKIGDDRTVAQWAEGVGQNTQMFAFAQDLVDQKIPDKIRETNPELAQKIEEAAKQKQDVTVPVSEILKVATKDETTAKTIANNSRLDADGMTPVQAEEFEKNGKKKALEEFQQIMEKNQPKIENRKQIDARFDKVQAEMEEQLVKAGKNKDDAHALTMPWRAHFAMLANWLGESPEALFKRLETQVQKQQAEIQKALNQAGLQKQGTGKKLDKQFMANQRKLARWTPEVYKSRKGQEGQYRGAPPGINTINDFTKLVKKLKGYAQEGVAGRFWYEASAEYVYDLVRGNIKDADKIIRLIAIYSPQMEIAPNLLMALRAWDYYKSGKPEKGLKLKTDVQDEKARAVLWHDGDWDGRKTNSFYQNLMYALIMQHPEECKAAGLNIEEFKRGQSTIDMWIRRVLGYPNDATTDDKGTGAYTFAENTLAKIAAQLNQNLAPNEEPWTPHQVQAAIWTSVKSRYVLSKDEAWKHLGKIGQLEMAPVIDQKTNLQKINMDGTPRVKESKKKGKENENIQHEVEFQFAEKVRSEDAKAYSDAFARSFATELNRMVQNVTWEAMPSKDVPGTKALLDASPEVKRHFTEEVASIFSDPNEIDKVVKVLNGDKAIVHLGKTASGNGGYQGVVSPNIITQMLPVWWGKEGEPSKAFVRAYCRILQYVLKQEAVPFFRFENRPAWIKKNYFKVGNRNFATQDEAQKYADAMNKKHPPKRTKANKNQETTTQNSEKTQEGKPKYFVVGGQLSRTYVFAFENTPTNAQLEDLFDKIIKATGVKDSGLTRIDNKVIVTNFRGGDQNLPKITDEKFVTALNGINAQGVVKTKITWTDSEYGHGQDWKADPTGSELLRLIDEAVKESRKDESNGNDASRPQRDGASSSQELQDILDHWKTSYEGILAKYTESYIKGLEQQLANQQQSLQQSQVGTGENVSPLTQYLLQLAYHGSPYKFSKFSLEHIGNGEGSQVHGWGLYFALSRAVAEGYKKILSDNIKRDSERFVRGVKAEIEEELQAYPAPSERKRKSLERRLALLKTFKALNYSIARLDKYLKEKKNRASKETIEWFNSEIRSEITESESTIYTVDIPEDDVMLREEADFDKQPPKVRKALLKMQKEVLSIENKHLEAWKKQARKRVNSFLARNFFRLVDPIRQETLAFIDEAKSFDDVTYDKLDKRLERISDAIDEGAEELRKSGYFHDRYSFDMEKGEALNAFFNEVAKARSKGSADLDVRRLGGRDIYDLLSSFLGSDMEASLMLNRYGIQGIRYNGNWDGECAVVFDDTTIKIVDMLNQLAYHGTGYERDILQFTLDHVGEGEGAQAHGYGLYFALLQQVARNYKDKLSSNSYQVQGQDDTGFRMQLEQSANAQKGEERKKLFDRLAAFDEWYANHNVDAVKEAYERGEITEDAYKWFNKEVAPNITSSGGLYLVDIPNDNVLLHEASAFEDQPAEVQEAVKKLFKNEFSKEQLIDFYREQWYSDAMEQMQDYSEYISVPNPVLRALDKLAKEEGPQIFADEKKVLRKIASAINEAAEEEYSQNKDEYEGSTKREAIKEIKENIIKEAGLNADGIFDTLYSVATDNYPSLLSGNPEFELSNTVHGFEIYNKIAQLAGSKKEASALLNKYGVKGIRYTGIEDGECAVVWDEESIKILDRLQQMGEQLKSQTTQGPRGSYIPKNTAEQYRQSVITLMENSDESTFLHESAHAFLDIDTMLAKDIAEKMDRGEEITVGEAAFMKNLGGFFKWGQQEGVIDLGVTDDIRTVAEAAKRWSNLTLAEQRGMHELFAEGFEAYCMEGVAPNKEMEDIFSRFKKWLIDVYSKLMHQPKPISREVRKLYDLMFATEQQAIETETKLGFRAMFDMDMAKKLGMTEEELRQYLILNDQATQETAGLVAKKVHGAMRIFGRVRKAEARRIENERRKEIKKREEELRKEPRYKALSMLNSNKVKMSEESLRALGLKDETIDLFKSRGWVSDEGMAVPVLASTLGTDDTMGLVSDLVDLERMSDLHEEVIKQLAWEDKVEHNGEGDFRELQADLCAYNETRSRLLVAEFNAIMRKLGGQQLMVRAAREYAFDQINQMKVSDVHEKSFMAAERRCAKEAEQAFIKGDFNAVIEAKRGQILNHELARAALEAKDRFQRGKNAAKSALKSKTVHPFYKRIVDALLANHSVSQMSAEDREKFGLGAPLSEDEISGIEAKLQENGTPCEGLAKLLRDHTHTQEMTVGDADAFFRVVTQITTNGRNLLKLSKIREGERVDETVKELEEQADKAGKAQGRERNLNLHEPQTSAQRRKKSVMDFLLGNTKISAWCKILDMNKAGGIFWEVFIKPANECATFEAEQRKRAAEWLRDKLLPAFKKNEDEDPIHIEGFKEPLTHGVRLAVALNLGNESNRQRLVQNDPRFTPEALQQITDTLTEADWRAVEAVWQLFESFRPMIAEKELRVNGIEPEWIEYEPFQVTTKEGKLITVSGGYYPVVYDYEASERSGVLEEAKKAERMMQGAYQSPTTDRSFTKKRVPGEVTGRPLRLNLSVLYEGVNDVIHDLAWHEWLIDTGHILHGSTMSQTDGIKQTIKELYGSGVANEFEQWRMDIALGDRGVGTPAWFSALTRNVGMASMGYSLTTAAAQLTGVGYVIPQTGVPAFLHALTKYMAHPFSMRKNINASSDAMRLRAQTQFKELAQIRNRLQKGKGTIAWMQDHAFVLTELVQSFADTVAWQAAYEKFSRDGFEGDKLIKMCDQVVVSTQASGNIHDLSRFERNKGYAKIFGVFYSWMNAALNLAVTEALGETNKFKKFANLFFMCVLMPYIEQSFRDALSADGDDDDDKDKDAIDKYVRDPIATVVEYNLGTLMFVREASNTAGRVIKGEPIFGYSGPAGLRTFKTANDSLAVLGRLAETYEDPNYDRLIKNIIDVAGAAIGAPSTQIKRTMKGLKAVDQGKVEGIDAIKAPLFGYNGKVE